MNDVITSLVSSVGMLVVAGIAVIYWRRVSGLQFRWFWVGAGLWTVAVILKGLLSGPLTNCMAGWIFKAGQSHAFQVLGGGLFVGLQSSLFEIGLTFFAVLLWRTLGRDADRAIGIGLGAGAFEAIYLGISVLVSIVASTDVTPAIQGAPGKELQAAAAVAPLIWLAPAVERAIAIVCHTSSRALVLLGTTHRKPMMVASGFLIFTLIDGIGGAVLMSGEMGKISAWWLELALLPVALVSLPILRWCHLRWSASARGLNRNEAPIAEAQQIKQDRA
jgi:hypothetical protein